LFFYQTQIVVAEAVIETQLARHLPGILDVACGSVVTEPQAGRRAVVDPACQAEQVTGVRKSGGLIGPPAVLPDVRGLGLLEVENAMRAGIAEGRESFPLRLAAELNGVIASHPSQAGVRGGLVVLRILVRAKVTG